MASGDTGLEESERLRVSALDLLSTARSTLELSAEALRRLIATPCSAALRDDGAYSALALLADNVLNRRRYTTSQVDGFYTHAQQGRRGEATFIGGPAALRLHDYSADVVRELPAAAADRFLGLGNVWRGIDPAPGQRVIDVGCGSGVDLTVAAIRSGRTAFLVGVDKRPDLLGVAARACPQALLVRGDITASPISDGAFDIVVANGLPPLQRATSLTGTAAVLQALTVPGGIVSATVIVASPTLTTALAELFPDDDRAFTIGLSRLVSGKPTGEDLTAAFIGLGSTVTVEPGANPYRDHAEHRRTALVTVRASRR